MPDSSTKSVISEEKEENPFFLSRIQPIDWAVITALTLLAYAIRWWYFTRTVGITFSLGVEEAARLKMVVGLYGPNTTFPILKTMGPFQMIVGKLGLIFFPETAYITRWISFLCGIIAPGTLYLALKDITRPARYCAALALCISPAHIWFSTVGVAESLTIFLILASCLCYVRADSAKHTASVWACLAVALLSAAFMTRFETWILAPVFFADALWRFRKRFVALWLLAFAAPAAWLIYSKFQWQGFFSSVNLHVVEMTPTEVFNHAWLALKYMHEAGGLFCEILGVAGFLTLVIRKETRFIALIGISIIAFEFAMIFNKELVSDPKYSRALMIWVQIYAGAFIGMAFIYLQEKMKIFRMIPPLRAGAYQLLLLTLVTAISLISGNPSLKHQLETTLVEQGGDFQAAGQLVKYIDDQMRQKPNAKFALLTSKANRNYIFLHMKPQLQKRIFIPPMDYTTVQEFIVDTSQENKSLQNLGGFQLVTEPYGGYSPSDDLPKAGPIGKYRILRARRVGFFKIYDLLE